MCKYLTFQIWNFILNNDNIKDVLKSTPQIKDEWITILKDVVESRISHVPNTDMVNLLCEVENHRHKNDFILNILMDRTSKILHQLFLKDQVKVMLIFWCTCTSHNMTGFRFFFCIV